MHSYQILKSLLVVMIRLQVFFLFDKRWSNKSISFISLFFGFWYFQVPILSLILKILYLTILKFKIGVLKGRIWWLICSKSDLYNFIKKKFIHIFLDKPISTKNVTEWLDSLGMSTYEPMFFANGFDSIDFLVSIYCVKKISLW